MEETPKKIISRTLSSQVVEALETAISSGRWEIGQKIPSEQELIELYGVSRNTLREAMQYLVNAGVVDVRPGDGTYVRSRTAFDATLQKRLAKEELSTIMETRLVEQAFLTFCDGDGDLYLHRTLCRYIREQREEEARALTEHMLRAEICQLNG